MDIPERVFPIGRLDKDTTGLIILTNDGRLSNYLMHPRYEHEKEYIVHVYGTVADEALDRLSRGVKILDDTITTKPALVRRVNSGAFSIVIREGKNRQIRRMVEAVGHEVKRLKRIRIETLQLGDMPEGSCVLLTRAERRELLERVLPDGADAIDMLA